MISLILERFQDWWRGESPSFPASTDIEWEVPESVYRDAFRKEYVFIVLSTDKDAHLMPAKVLIKQADEMFDALKGDDHE